MKHTLLFLLLALTGCGQARRFEAAERQFQENFRHMTVILNDIERHYRHASSDKIASLHAGYLRSGTFDRLDSLSDRQYLLIHDMVDNCPRYAVAQLSVYISTHIGLSDRITRVEIPFNYKRFPSCREPGMPRRAR